MGIGNEKLYKSKEYKALKKQSHVYLLYPQEVLKQVKVLKVHGGYIHLEDGEYYFCQKHDSCKNLSFSKIQGSALKMYQNEGDFYAEKMVKFIKEKIRTLHSDRYSVQEIQELTGAVISFFGANDEADRLGITQNIFTFTNTNT